MSELTRKQLREITSEFAKTDSSILEIEAKDAYPIEMNSRDFLLTNLEYFKKGYSYKHTELEAENQKLRVGVKIGEGFASDYSRSLKVNELLTAENQTLAAKLKVAIEQRSQLARRRIYEDRDNELYIQNCDAELAKVTHG